MPALAFQFYEIRPCIEIDDNVESFVTEAEYKTALARHQRVVELDGLPFKTFWTLYGRYDDGDGAMLAMAIADFADKAAAFEVMNAILAPFARARDIIEGDDVEGDNGATITGAEQAVDYLAEVINRSSTPEEI